MREYVLNQALSIEEAGGSWLGRLWRNWQARRAVSRLESLDDYILRDIGVTRSEVNWAVGLPLNVNAALALEERSSQRLRIGRQG